MDYDLLSSYYYRYEPLFSNISTQLGRIMYDVLTLYNHNIFLGERLKSCSGNISNTSEENLFLTTKSPFEKSVTTVSTLSNNLSENTYFYNQSYVMRRCLFQDCHEITDSEIFANCQAIFDTAKKKANALIVTIGEALNNDTQRMIDFSQGYQIVLNLLYYDASVKYEDIAEHIECQDNLEEINRSLEIISNIQTSLNVFATTSTKEDMISYANKLYQMMNSSLIKKYMEMDATFKESCTWFYYSSEKFFNDWCDHDSTQKDYDCEKFSNHLSNLDNVIRTSDLFEIDFLRLGRHISDMHVTMKSRNFRLIEDTILAYVDMNITKMELAVAMESLIGRNSLPNIIGDGIDFVSTASETIQAAGRIQHNLKEGYRSILTTVVPVYHMTSYFNRHHKNIKNIPFIKFLISRNISQTNEILEQLEQNATQVMDELLDYIFGGYVDIVSDIRDRLRTTIDNLSDVADRLNEDLEIHKRLGRMDEDFYM